jgi:hypothetical protein
MVNNVSILDFCDDMKMNSKGMSDHQIAVNKIKCGMMRARNSKYGTQIVENYEGDAINLSEDVPQCIYDFECVEVSDFDIIKRVNWKEKGNALGAGMVGMLGMVLSFQKEGNELVMIMAIEILGERMFRRLMGKVLTKGILKTVGVAAKKGVMKLAGMNIAIARTIAKKAIIKAATKLAQKGVVEGVKQGGGAVLKFLGPTAACPPCAPVFAIIAVFQLATAFFDMWDPFGCNKGVGTVQNMGKSHIDLMSRLYNEWFVDSYLSSTMKSTVMPNGNVVSVENKWPIEYDILGVGNTDDIVPHNDTITKLGFPTEDEDGAPLMYSWALIELMLMSQYLGTMTKNSYGQPIYMGYDAPDARLLTLDDLNFDELDGAFALSVSNSNTDLAKWIYAWWPIIILIIFILIFVIIKLV